MCKNLKEKHTKTSPSALQCPENKTEAAGEANNTAQRVVYVNWTGEEAEGSTAKGRGKTLDWCWHYCYHHCSLQGLPASFQKHLPIAVSPCSLLKALPPQP